MSNAIFKRHAFRALLVLHLIGLTLVVGVRFALFGIEQVTGGGSLQYLAQGRDLMGTLAGSLTAPGFWLTMVTGVGMVVLRYGRSVPRWVWVKVALTGVGLVLALSRVAPALEAARRWAHQSAVDGRLAPLLHVSVTQAALYGGIVFALFLLAIPVSVWKPRLERKAARVELTGQ